MSVELEVICQLLPQGGSFRRAMLMTYEKALLTDEQAIPGQGVEFVLVDGFERSEVEASLHDGSEVSVAVWVPSVACFTNFVSEGT